jgi:hypothetical protein
MRKRTHARGVAIAVSVKLAAVLAFAYVGAKVTRYIAEANGVPSPLVDGAFEIYSVGWYVSQVVGVLIGLLAGFVCAYYAPPRTWWAPAILSVGYLALGVATVPTSSGWFYGIYWVLASPVSLLLGTLAYKHVASTNDA